MKRLLLLALPLALAGCPKPAERADTPAPTVAATTLDTAAAATIDAAALLPQYHWQLMDATDTQGKRIDALFVRPDKPVQFDFRKDGWACPTPAIAWAAPTHCRTPASPSVD